MGILRLLLHDLPRLALPTLVALSVASASARADLRWKGKTYTTKALPAELPAGVASAAAPWEAWAKSKGYTIWVSAAGDCLLVADRRSSSVEESLGLIADTIAAVDRFLPPRADEPLEEASGTGPAPSKPLEDFDLPPVAGSAAVVQPRTPHQVPVLLAARGPADYRGALAMLVSAHPWLADWAKRTGDQAYGMALPRPLVGAWLVEAPENEEWDPRNELVHRLAQLLVLDRAGRVPYWMLVGTAWNVELEVRGGIYCFPYRYGFVGIGEHGGWAPGLRSRFGDRQAAPLDAKALSALRRGSYDDGAAALAWGGMRWLIAEHHDSLPALCADLDLNFREQAVERHEDGTWSSLPDWEWSLEQQADLLRRHIGRDVWERMAAAFREGL